MTRKSRVPGRNSRLYGAFSFARPRPISWSIPRDISSGRQAWLRASRRQSDFFPAETCAIFSRAPIRVIVTYSNIMRHACQPCCPGRINTGIKTMFSIAPVSLEKDNSGVARAGRHLPKLGGTRAKVLLVNVRIPRHSQTHNARCCVHHVPPASMRAVDGTARR